MNQLDNINPQTISHSHKVQFKVSPKKSKHKNYLINSLLKDKLNTLFKINQKTKYLDYKLINSIVISNYKISKMNPSKAIHKESVDVILNKKKENYDNKRNTCNLVMFFNENSYKTDMEFLVSSLETKLLTDITNIKNVKNNKLNTFLMLLNTLTLIQLLISHADSEELIKMFFLNENLISMLFSLQDKSMKNILYEKGKNEWNMFKNLILSYTVNNFLLGEIKEKLCLIDPILYINLFNKFSSSKEIVNNYYPKNIYSDLLAKILHIDIDIESLKNKFKDDEFVSCKYNKNNYLYMYLHIFIYSK